MKIKKIGIVGWSLGENSFGVTKTYLQYFSQYGQVEIITPSNSIRKDLDLIVLPGGADISPKTYGQYPGFLTGNPDVFKEHFMNINLPKYIENGSKIFGICLGLQQIGVHFGASMIQDISLYHEYSKERNDLVHKIKISESILEMMSEEDKSMFIKNTKEKKIKYIEVNSMHHQVINKEAFPDCLEALAISFDDNYVEAIRHKELPIYGVQWHPEEIYDVISNTIINKLLE